MNHKGVKASKESMQYQNLSFHSNKGTVQVLYNVPLHAGHLGSVSTLFTTGSTTL